MTAAEPARAVAVVGTGTGTMGQGMARVVLAAGHPVRLYDVVAGRARHAAGARPHPADDLSALPLSRCDRLGADRVYRVYRFLTQLNNQCPGGRYAPSQAQARRAAAIRTEVLAP